ncbi:MULTISPECIES: L,D-transpeptidase [Bosea]|uniref:L,D-transpeptidase n=1 Tax=Bosea TaxID=85413 RepID=UPI00214F99CE|nr:MULTISPECIES: L,D-transpeptidase [Bosea]MCR4522352.1 L,D-transpeptidase [Bosea sp. 47.2.35]MDR6829179.1 lipoprotein-anchoring transpeptidase ErfK/SrfK [Bosea robiniae]MDR6896063.1 lipoprotein-anchoring transpeptidase ErfK/SrfK [Bosea sp. BE109]MDR7139460.1 lipoprotein-anchoring transpeptidase ErfK/SrfK [Bosea sp. BE168]MDR7176158.1 lipoprotein-anchoring transpeptidase ErfK/SrfK [Bosea sp. BE271]
MLRHVALAIIALSAASAAAPPVQAREIVGMRDGRFDPGTIVIRTGERKLYFVTAPGEAIRYTVAVGKAGKQWRGVKYVEELQVDPAWSPPAEVRRDNPRLPDVIPGGSPRNPMGARVIGLGPTGQYAIHGTNMPNTIGTAASYGCFRMHNQDVIDLYARVRMGTPVVVLP